MAGENGGVDKKNMYGIVFLNRFGKIETVFSSGFFLQLIKGVIENITGKNSTKTKILVPADLIM